MGFKLHAEIGKKNKSAFQCSSSTAWAGLGFWDESEAAAAALGAENSALPQSEGNKGLNATGGAV